MIVNSRYTTFMNSFCQDHPPLLRTIEQEALADHVPIIRKETQSLLRVMLAAARPGRILEVGTATGFSSLLMAEYAPCPVRITTIENYRKRIPIARENFRRAGRSSEITLLEGDAADVLKTLTEPFDFIFMDAAKGQYLSFLEDILRLLVPGGMLISDNVLQDGDIIESRYAVARRNRTIHKRMREYLYAITHREDLDSCILPSGDGVTISVKKPMRKDGNEKD
jgi:predicted O-methyltransferase YrrM